VSPVNARKRLTEFIAGAKKRLLIYEMKISDPDFLKLLNKKISDGVEVRILSRVSAKGGAIPVRRLPTRLHLRAILRDGKDAFVGSQSLRTLELEARREIGAIVGDKNVVKRMDEIFDQDWKRSEPVLEQDAITSSLNVPAKKVARQVARQIALKPMVEKMLDKVIESRDDVTIEPEEVAQTVQEVFQQEVRGAVVDALKEVVLQSAGEAAEQSAKQDAEQPAGVR
jgi:phosphatidylserine/phosphatidylglycerophosphate/cardiolipin synthase-like enzyme